MHLDHLPGSFFGPSNLVDLLRHRAMHQARDVSTIFLVDGESQEQSLTYAELDRRARAIGAWLQSMHLEGERALLLYPAGLDFIAAFFGCLYAGVVAVPVYPPRRNRSLARIEGIASDAAAKVALTTGDVLERVGTMLGETPALQRMDWLATDRPPASFEDHWQMPDVHGDTLAFLQYTSGSTGTPKGVMLTHANLMHNSALICYAFEHTRSGVGVFWLPSYHDMGLIGGILQPMYVGRPNILMSPASFAQKPLRWLQAISKYRGTVCGGPNSAYDHCVAKVTPEQRDKLDLSSWTLAFNGAEPVRAETIDAFCRFFAPCGFRREAFYPCYGMAEATLIISGGFKSLPPVIRHFDAQALEQDQVVDVDEGEDHARALVGCGGNLLDQKIVVVDRDSLARAAPGRVGEIWAAGPSVAEGYWNRPLETQETFRAYLSDTGEGPFLRTGDLGFIEGGELFITGRLKDLLIIRGLNYYPQDIEATVGRCHERLRQGACAAFAVTVEGRERLVVACEVERHRSLPSREICELIHKEVAAEHELPVEAIALLRTGTIPKTSSGKIQRYACRQGFLDGTLEILGLWKAWEGPPPPVAVEPPPEQPVGRAVLPDDRLAARLAEGKPIFVGSHGDNGAAAAAPPARDVRPSTADVVMEHVRRVGKERAAGLTLDTSIVELGLDSLERMEIVAALEEAFGGRFPESVLTQIETVREVAAAVETYLERAPQSLAPSKPHEVTAADYRIECFPEYQRLLQTRAAAQAAGLVDPYFKVHEGIINDQTTIDGRRLVSFCSYNYLGLSGDAEVVAAAKAAIDRFGTSVSASRLVSGEKTIHRELEAELARFLGVEAALVFVGGHSTNETVLGHLLGPGDLILHDALAHNSLVQGAILSGARRRAFAHNDWQALDDLLAQLRPTYRRVMVVVEGVYSMDGDFPELPRFIDVARRHQAMLYVDEAHSIGVMGPTGRGIGEHFAVKAADVDVWMGTLSKSLGSCGGYVAGSAALVEYLKYTAPGFVFSAGITPPNTAAALAALRKLEREPERVARLRRNAALFLELARAQGLNTGHSGGTPVIPVITGNSALALALSQALFERGLNVQPIMYPAVEEQAARLRFFLTASHNEAQIRAAVALVAQEYERLAATAAATG